jgi:iron complex outermembrane receptor protein
LTIPGDDRGNQDINSGRLQIGYTPSDATEMYLNIDVLDSKYNPMGGYAIEFTEVTPIAPRTDVFVEGVDFDNVPFTTFRDIREPVVQKNRGVSLSMEHRLENGFTLASITGWRDDALETVQDIDALPYDGYHLVRRDNKQEMLTQEFRVASPAYDSFDFVAGLYMLKQDSLYVPVGRIGEWWFGPGLAGVLADIENEVNVQSYAAFFHGNIRLTDDLTLFGGGRYTTETKKQNLISNFIRLPDGTPSASLCAAFGYECGTNVGSPMDIDDKEPSWTIGLRYTTSPDFMTYASIARGFKSSAFNYSNNQQKDFDNNVLMAKPEFVTSYEVGFKSDWLQNRLRVNASAFYMDYEDLQVKSFCPSCGLLGAGANIFSNAAAVTSRGFELEVRSQLTDSLSAGLGIGYVDSKFDDFKGLALPRGVGAPGDDKDADPVDGLTDASGNRVPLAPKWTANATLEHVHGFAVGGQLVSRLDYNFIDERFGAEGASNTAEYLLPAYGTLKMRVGYESSDERWSVYLWANNLTNELEPEEARFSAFISNRFGYRYIEPRTYGLSYTYGI